jgi:Mn2+/Fe2+ NRAMP family transporter
MDKLLEVSLGIVTSVGGYLEIGSIATSAQAGAAFGFQLLWALVLGTLCIIVLVEMSGRFAAVSHHTIADAMRERFGFNFFLLPLTVTVLLNLMVLSAEIGGVALAGEFATGIGHQWWAVPVGIVVWLLLWKGTFGLIEKGVALLGLVTLVFVVAAVKLGPDWKDLLRSAVPSLPQHDSARYWFLAASILGATISPYLFLFYSSGAIEDHWNESYLWANRAIAGIGMTFGGVISASTLVIAALLMPPSGIRDVNDYHQLPLLLTKVFGFWGLVLFIASLAIACLGAALEIALQQAYLVAQGFGWNWGKNLMPEAAPAFSLVYTLSVIIAVVPMVLGVDPLNLTVFSMALTAASLPLTILPFIFIMNDKRFVKQHTNGRLGNIAIMAIIALGFVLAIATIPLEIVSGG